jgi:hypothetical protein
MSKSKLTRRSLVASAAILPVAAVPIAVQATTEPDPIFAAIEAHKRAWSELEGILIKASRARVLDPNVDQAHDLLDETADKLVEIVPTTVAGAVALLTYAAEFAHGGNSWPNGYATEHPCENSVAWEVVLHENLARALPTIMSQL